MPKQLSELETMALRAVLSNEKKYNNRVQKVLADALTEIRGEMSKIYSKYAKNGILTRAEMTKYNKYITMEKEMIKILDPAIVKVITQIKRLGPDQYNQAFFHYAWAIDQASGINISWGTINQDTIRELYSITNPKNIEMAEALHNYGPKARRYLRNALLQNLPIGKSYASMIKDIRNGLNKTYNEAIRIIRTEGQRALNKGQDDLYLRALGKGIEGKIIWDATLDGKTRITHRQMDGVAKSEDGYFYGAIGKATRPLDEVNLPAEEVINCRCRERFEIEGYAPQLRRTREQGIIPYQTYEQWENNYGKVKE